MTAEPLPDPDEARALMRAKLQALGLDLDEVQAALSEVQGPEAEWTVATAVVEGLIRMRRDLPRSAITYAPYLEDLAAGLPDVCPCSCVHCAKTACSCRPGPMGHRGACSGARDEPGLDCSLRFPGLGGKLVREVEADDISDAAWWLERRGLKRVVARNAKRVEERRVTQGLLDQIGAQVVGKGPADDAAGGDVDDGGEVGPRSGSPRPGPPCSDPPRSVRLDQGRLVQDPALV